ncbi:hypothetical protein Dda_1126 [Drechslerella dactyloides]|uniref:Uncharacterized protein n=1 Tax=Drechslerella dactyloides TaxID=74499 RepID=A0AAD6J8K7_DREDA|nr:hypothetical protein Dda_1126 [Drechslerella dactyloides]
MAERKKTAKQTRAPEMKARRRAKKSQSGDCPPSNQNERERSKATPAAHMVAGLDEAKSSVFSLATPSSAGMLHSSSMPKTSTYTANEVMSEKGQGSTRPSTPTWSNKRRRSTSSTDIASHQFQQPATYKKAKVEPTTTPSSFSPSHSHPAALHAADPAKDEDDKDDAVGDPHWHLNTSIVAHPTATGASWAAATVTAAAAASAPPYSDPSKAEAPPSETQVETAKAESGAYTSACVVAGAADADADAQLSNHSSSNPTADRHDNARTLPLPNFEWIEVSHTPEVFLIRLQLRSFLLLFGDLAPPARRPLKLKYVRQKVLCNPNLMWTSQEMGRMMQTVVSIVGDELVDLLPTKRTYVWSAGIGGGRGATRASSRIELGSKNMRRKTSGGQHASRATASAASGGSIVASRQRKQAIVSRLMQKVFTDDMWEDFLELLDGAEPRLFAHGHDVHVAGTGWQEDSRSRGRTSREYRASNSGGGRPAGRGRGRGKKQHLNIRSRVTAGSKSSNAANLEPAVKYELLRRLLVVAASCSRIKQRLQDNEEVAKSAANATKTAGKTLKAELGALIKDLKVRKKANANEEIIKELEGKVTEAHGQVSSLSLTNWLDMRKLDPRSSRPIGADLLGNVYYILPPVGEEDGEAAPALVGYASWVLCQKGPGLDHPLGKNWVEAEGDGGRTKEFYAVDGAPAIGELVEWIRQQEEESREQDGDKEGREGGGGGGPSACATTADCDVLVEKLQQFAQMLRAAATLAG